VVCSHGDIVPALAAFVTGSFDLSLPAPHSRRGGWYTLRLNGEQLEMDLNSVLPDFSN
jgi:hypothetical protein